MDERMATATRRGETYGGRSRQERANDRRDRIEAAALHLFGTRDYDAVTVADVCAEARVSKRYFYEHFNDREHLLLTVHNKQNAWLLAAISASAPRDPSSVGELFGPIMSTLVTMLRANPERARVVYVNAPRMETRRRGVLREDAAHFDRVIRHFFGDPEDPLRHDRVLLALVSGVSEVIIDWLSRGMEDDPELLAAHLTWLITTLLTGR